MKTRIVRIGNSQGVRIPKTLLEASGLGPDVEIEAEDGQIVIRPAQPAPGTARGTWDQSFREMAEHGDDAMLDGNTAALTSWDEEEWEW
jgi:antitoxin MazE